jgi:ferrochelatase
VFPAYPQYSAATTASVIDDVADWTRRTRRVPELRFVNHYHDDPGYIEALARRVDEHWMAHGEPERLVLSFHGVPRRTLLLGDPYHCECRKTARLLAARLRLKPEQIVVTFQSRFGRAQWLEPYTEPTLVAMARQGIKRVDVMCPGFTADCLETLQEIDQEARQAFMAAGGGEFHCIPCLNDQHEWMAALSALALRHLQGWPTDGEDAADNARQRDRAVAMGAPR